MHCSNLVGSESIFTNLFFRMSVVIHTCLGDLRAELFCSLVPNACRNFLALAASGFYDGLTFHRNIAGFIIQGGDPTDEGKGGSNYKGELQADEFVNELKHNSRGILSFANLNKPETVGSQFFITYGKQPHLDGMYTVFGRLIGNYEPTLANLEAVPVIGKKGRPVDPIKINRISILSNPIADSDNPL